MDSCLRSFTQSENDIVSVERVLEYTHLPSEALWETDYPKPVEWPDKGTITFKQYSTKYREGLDLVLKDISLTIEPGKMVI